MHWTPSHLVANLIGLAVVAALGRSIRVPAVLAKYQLVHDMDRAGSMLDNIIYYNLYKTGTTFSFGGSLKF